VRDAALGRLRDSSLGWMLGPRVRHRASPVRHLAGLRRPSAAPWFLGPRVDILLSDLDGFGGPRQSDLGFCSVDDGPSGRVCAGCRRRSVPGSLCCRVSFLIDRLRMTRSDWLRVTMLGNSDNAACNEAPRESRWLTWASRTRQMAGLWRSTPHPPIQQPGQTPVGAPRQTRHAAPVSRFRTSQELGQIAGTGPAYTRANRTAICESGAFPAAHVRTCDLPGLW